MSVKRQATTELNHENWDQDDPADPEEGGSFKIASKDILEKRVIRTAKRRSQIAGDEPKKSVFSGFGGFNKTQPASFDFLSKLTNGNNENNTSISKVDSSVTSSLFTSKPITTSPGTGLFSLQTSTAATKSPFGSPSTFTGTGSLFGVSSSNSTPSTNLFSTSKADSTVGDSPFKVQTVTSSTDNKTDAKSTTISATAQFDIPTTTSNVTKSLFSTTSNSTPFKIQPVTNTVQSNFGIITKSDSNATETEIKSDHSKNESKMKYYSKLKGLNESVSDWIKKHVEQTPLCILTPIFKDYEKYLKEIQDEYEGSDKTQNKKTDDKAATSETKTDSGSINTKQVSPTMNSNITGSNIFNISPSSKSLFASQNDKSATGDKSSTFSFGINATSSIPSTVTKSPSGFTFGVATSNQATTTASPFSIGTSSSTFSFAANTNTTATNGSAAAPFSFGMGKPFSFNTNVKQNVESTEEPNKEDEDDIPPKVEFTPVVEENSVYDKKCKIFVKKDGNFVDKGVGTLYIKKIEESGKHQLLVRANTNLGTILVNLILVSAIPTQRMGKNNVMLVCIPTPDSKPPPTPILIRVKTSEEADELLATLDKYKT